MDVEQSENKDCYANVTNTEEGDDIDDQDFNNINNNNEHDPLRIKDDSIDRNNHQNNYQRNIIESRWLQNTLFPNNDYQFAVIHSSKEALLSN